MITADMTFDYPDGTHAKVTANRWGGWNIETESSTITGITDVEVEQHVARAVRAKAQAAHEAAAHAHATAVAVEKAHDAAITEDARRARAARKSNFVPGTEYLRYSGIDSRHEAATATLLWLEEHHNGIYGSVKSLEQFCANYAEAGHAYTANMDGLRVAHETSWFDTFVIRLDGTPIPYGLLDDIARLQYRCGIREGQKPTFTQGKGIYCNALAWELIRRGAKLGPRGNE